MHSLISLNIFIAPAKYAAQFENIMRESLISVQILSLNERKKCALKYGKVFNLRIFAYNVRFELLQTMQDCKSQNFASVTFLFWSTQFERYAILLEYSSFHFCVTKNSDSQFFIFFHLIFGCMNFLSFINSFMSLMTLRRTWKEESRSN